MRYNKASRKIIRKYGIVLFLIRRKDKYFPCCSWYAQVLWKYLSTILTGISAEYLNYCFSKHLVFGDIRLVSKLFETIFKVKFLMHFVNTSWYSIQREIKEYLRSFRCNFVSVTLLADYFQKCVVAYFIILQQKSIQTFLNFSPDRVLADFIRICIVGVS